MIYGAELSDGNEVTIENFTELIDDKSWLEFMPKGITKKMFKQFSKYYDPEIFIEAGNKIRNITKYADTLNPTERIKEIANLFATFKNPDKETVLTPWKVVNMHMGDTIGGYNFYDEKYIVTIEEPRLILNGEITTDVLNNKTSKVLEINSKTGLYPLYVSYSIFRQRCLDTDEKKLDEELEMALWQETLKENIYVITKTKMGKSITKRTLAGFNNFETNILCFENIINELKTDIGSVVDIINNPKSWNIKDGGEMMKFNAVVGNPPYQEEIYGREEQPPIYHLFYDAAMQISSKVSLITPGRFLFDAGKTPSVWNKKMLNDIHFRVVNYFPDSKSVFNNVVDIKGGVVITMWNLSEKNPPIEVFFKDNVIRQILQKVNKNSEKSLASIWYSNTSYKYSKSFFEDNPKFIERVSGGSKRYMSSSAFDKFPEVFYSTIPDDDKDKYAQIVGRQNSKRIIYYFKLKYLNPPSNFDKYKVFISSSNGTGKLGESLSTPFLGRPYVGATETFLSFGCFDTADEANNLIKYLKTKFARIMLGTKKVTQGNKNIKVWTNVPLQDFSVTSEINWDVSIEEIDIQLYKKYNLSDEEIDYIEKIAVGMR